MGRRHLAHAVERKVAVEAKQEQPDLHGEGIVEEQVEHRQERLAQRDVLLLARPMKGRLQKQRLVVIDEIGPMEIRSAIFRETVNEALDSEVPVLATIFARSLPFTDAIKSRPDVTLIEVRPDNRERLVSELSDRIQALNPG